MVSSLCHIHPATRLGTAWQSTQASSQVFASRLHSMLAFSEVGSTAMQVYNTAECCQGDSTSHNDEDVVYALD